MAIVKKISRSKAAWGRGGLLQHFLKHGEEVSLIRGGVPGWDEDLYDWSARDSLKNPLANFIGTTADRSPELFKYFLDYKSLISITIDKSGPMLKTHFPLGTEGKSDCGFLGTFPEEVKTIHGLRELYIRIRSGRYIVPSGNKVKAAAILKELIEKEVQFIQKNETKGLSDTPATTRTKENFLVDYSMYHQSNDGSTPSEWAALNSELSTDQVLISSFAMDAQNLMTGDAKDRLFSHEGYSIPKTCDKAFSTFAYFAIAFEKAAIIESLDSPPEWAIGIKGEVMNVIARYLRSHYQSAPRSDYRKSLRSYFEKWSKNIALHQNSIVLKTIKLTLSSVHHA